MSRARKLTGGFAIDMPADLPSEPASVPRGESRPRAPRRGPMAAAVAETAEAAADRARLEAAARAENDRLAAEHVAARRAGLVLRAVDPDAVEIGWLHRDRVGAEDADLPALKASIAALGLSNPIQLAALPDGRLALVQGWRRLTAWRALRAETGDPAWDRIPAAVAPAEQGEGRARAYRRMVDENLVRRDVSFAEMALLARAYADDHLAGDAAAAVDALFAAAGPQKRSYIRGFVTLTDALGGALRWPEAVPRALGLAARDRLRAASDEAVARLRAALDAATDPAAQTAALKAFSAPVRPPSRPPSLVAPPATLQVTAADGATAALSGATLCVTLATAPAAPVGEGRLREALDAFLRVLSAADAGR